MRPTLLPLLLMLSGAAFQACANAIPGHTLARGAPIELGDTNMADIKSKTKRSHDTRLKKREPNLISWIKKKAAAKSSLPDPQSPEKVNPRFLVYTNPDRALEVRYNENKHAIADLLNRGQKLYIVVHGFLSSASADWMQTIKNEILAVETATVILVDWEDGASKIWTYKQASANTKVVAREVANLLTSLKNAGRVELKNVHYIGHSLGAQMATFLARELSSMVGAKIGRITGLDPAAPCFRNYAHLSKEDADFVDILHTSMNNNSWTRTILDRDYQCGVSIDCGHVDFYPNGGTQQPGCATKGAGCSCSHSRATLYYANSIRTCKYPTQQCSTYEAFKRGQCGFIGKNRGHMGHKANPQMEGRHFLNISSVEPHCEGNGGSASAKITWVCMLVSVIWSLLRAVCLP